MARPLIGITIDNVNSSIASGKYESNLAYSRAVAEAGGLPLLLPQEVELASHYVSLCDGLMLTGGDDALSEHFGFAAHPQAKCMDPQRQTFDLALLNALDQQPHRPVLGICLGMQLMALHGGGRLHQHLPDLLPDATAVHQNDQQHTIVIGISTYAVPTIPTNRITSDSDAVPCGVDLTLVSSSHHQAVDDPGRLRILAHSPDGIIEAIDDPHRPFYVGVQWHPERGRGLLNQDLIQRFVKACRHDRALSTRVSSMS
jgi:putative glutamine amidotransferase